MLNNYFNLFDHIFIINNENNEEHQDYIENFFLKNKIFNYSFLEKNNENSQEVEAIYSTEQTHKYPPCFNCGKNTCNCASNILQKSHVVEYLAYLDCFKRSIQYEYKNVLILNHNFKFLTNIKSTFRNLFSINDFQTLLKKNIPYLIDIGSNKEVSLSVNKLELLKCSKTECTGSVVLNIEYMKNFLKQFTKISSPIETELLNNKYNSYLLYITQPLGIIQKKEKYQKIENNNFNYIAKYYLQIFSLNSIYSKYLLDEILSIFPYDSIILMNDQYQVPQYNKKLLLDQDYSHSSIIKNINKKTLSGIIETYYNKNLEEIQFNEDNSLFKSYGFKIIFIEDPIYIALEKIREKNSYYKNMREIFNFTKLWKEYANEYLGNTELINNSKKIIVNKFLFNKEYRDQITKELQLPVIKKQDLKINDFFKNITNTEKNLIKKILMDKEFIQLYLQIFDTLPNMGESNNKNYY